MFIYITIYNCVLSYKSFITSCCIHHGKFKGKTWITLCTHKNMSPQGLSTVWHLLWVFWKKRPCYDGTILYLIRSESIESIRKCHFHVKCFIILQHWLSPFCFEKQEKKKLSRAKLIHLTSYPWWQAIGHLLWVMCIKIAQRYPGSSVPCSIQTPYSVQIYKKNFLHSLPPPLPKSSKHYIPFKYHIHIWQVSLKTTLQWHLSVWMWFNGSDW